MWQVYRADLKEHLRKAAWAEWFLAHRHVFIEPLGKQVDLALGEIAEEPAAV